MRMVLASQRTFAIALCVSAGFCAAMFSSASTVDDELARVKKRVAELQPTAKEKRFDEIGWAKDIREAKRLAKDNNRPVFLFTHDGRMNVGRC